MYCFACTQDDHDSCTADCDCCFDPDAAASWDRLAQLRAEIENPTQKDGMAMLDAAIADVMARTAPGRHSGHRDPFSQDWVKPTCFPTHDPAPLCRCERNPYAEQLHAALEFNERRELGQARWELPLWVAKTGLRVMRSCPAALHFTSATLDTWLTPDVRTSQDEEVVESNRRQSEALLAEQSSRDTTEERRATEEDADGRIVVRGEYDDYAAQEAFVRELATQRREALIRLIEAIGGDPRTQSSVEWVRGVMEKKRAQATRPGRDGGTVVTATEDQIRLRAYSSCLFQLRRKLDAGQVQIKVAA